MKVIRLGTWQAVYLPASATRALSLRVGDSLSYLVKGKQLIIQKMV